MQEFTCNSRSMTASCLHVRWALYSGYNLHYSKWFDYMPTFILAYPSACSRLVPFPLSVWPATTALNRKGWVGGAYFFSRVSIKHYMSSLVRASAGVHMQPKQHDSEFFCTCGGLYIVALICITRGGLTACQHIYWHIRLHVVAWFRSL